MRNLTPSHLRCGTGLCPSITQLEDGRLVIRANLIGLKSTSLVREGDNVVGTKGDLSTFVTDEEVEVIISPEYFADYISQHVDAAVRAEREALNRWRNDCGILLAQIDYLTEATGEHLDCQDAGLVEQIRTDYRAAIRSRGNANG
jgi:hypothetical protein